MLVATQDSSSSIDTRLPFHRLDPNHEEVRLSSSASSSAMILEDPHPAVRREQYRRKLVGLHHAAFCTNVGQHQPSSSCCGQLHCLAHKRIFTHMHACLAGSKCVIPGCAKARLIWTHFSTCTAMDCSICSVIPAADRQLVPPPAKAHLPRSPKSGSSSSTTPTRRKPGRPPLSPKPKFQFHDLLPPRSPPGSPTLVHSNR
mmetsp:Transcript_6518/g.13431  ORF Transcript_6518/g.13431 Transcript_6518/m.13431 type:complete len:201 (-) Transcript_6518:77-679(-)